MDVETEQAVRTAIEQAAGKSRLFPAERLDRLGWDELLAADTESAVRILFEEKGRRLLVSPALDSVVHNALAGPWQWAAAPIVYPRPGSVTVLTDDGTRLDGLLLADPAQGAEQLLAPLPSGDGARLAALPVAGITATPVSGIDDSLELWRVTAARDRATELREGNDWDAGLSAARRALAHETIGLSRRMMHIVVEHVRAREQFGRPLGANQAVQHRLADAEVDLSCAEAIAEESWAAGTSLAAVAAKGAADRAFETIARHGQQLLGAIGYTWEHQWHHHLRRGLFLSALLGAADECERDVGRSLVQSGVVRMGRLR
ncbi:MAG TPA: acyl-CoA dehydrogenase family protein [Amycolatopsis sp.]|nr:acyl-CoA dehydrogenase family protein [Amycolatopsis sp.]